MPFDISMVRDLRTAMESIFSRLDSYDRATISVEDQKHLIKDIAALTLMMTIAGEMLIKHSSARKDKTETKAMFERLGLSQVYQRIMEEHENED